ncbi:hypothetical protein BSKO_10691 [Bryopsis sp. KO-2023]|nr:hypothetical protein BSKO_10691 [Bryopsis sp. KO-2023]
MPSITTVLQSLFGKKGSNLKVIFIGLDASGRTTLLYKLKLGDVVHTIPTIGFNVEDVPHKTSKFTIWDVGGGDKIRPLWRHYFQDLDGVVFFVDSCDAVRLPEARDEFMRLFCVDKFDSLPVVLFANKQDRERCMSVEYIEQKMELHKIRGSPTICIGGSAFSDQVGEEILDWLVEAQASRQRMNSEKEKEDKGTGDGGESTSKLEKWLETVDEPDDEFVQKLENYTLDSWDHRTHLRIAWLFLRRYGRRDGMVLIFDRIKNFIGNSPQTAQSRGTTFHESLTYFWVHMVHYAMESMVIPADNFKTFLVLNPMLCNGGLFLHYYTKALLIENPEAREKVVLPDKKPLPSLVSNVIKPANVSDPVPSTAAVETDAEFLALFENGELKKWNQECMLRVVWIYLKQLGRAKAVDVILNQLKRHEGQESFHLTITFFWIQMVSWILALDRKWESFHAFEKAQGYAQDLFKEFVIDKTYFLKYYKQKTIFSKEAQYGFVLPDKRQLPNVVKEKR